MILLAPSKLSELGHRQNKNKNKNKTKPVSESDLIK